MAETTAKSNIIYEVVPIRLFLIVMLVFYHAFAIFSGAWEQLDGYPKIYVYDVMDKLSYACLLETFVFISGYILGYQVRWKGTATVLKPQNILQSPNQKIPDRKTKCVIKTHINIKQNVIFGAKLKPV